MKKDRIIVNIDTLILEGFNGNSSRDEHDIVQGIKEELRQLLEDNNLSKASSSGDIKTVTSTIAPLASDASPKLIGKQLGRSIYYISVGQDNTNLHGSSNPKMQRGSQQVA